jgi:hypothetical protein
MAQIPEPVPTQVESEGHDIEEGTVPLVKAGSKLPEKPVWMNFPGEVQKQFQKRYGFVPILAPSKDFHSHPHLAWQRNHLEHEAFKLAEKFATPNYPTSPICDVGSAARAVRAGKFSVHCLVPLLQPGDAQRLTKVQRLVAGRVVLPNRLCSHRLQDCTCGPFESLVFTHSAYYFTTEELITAIANTKSKRAYVIGHSFPEVIGNFAYNEAQYRVTMAKGGPTVMMSVTGNVHSYSHKPLPWECGAVPTAKFGDVHSHLDVRAVRTVGDTTLWELLLVLGMPPVAPTLRWVEQIRDDRYIGPITVPGHDRITRQSLSANELLDIEIDHLHSWGKLLFTSTERGGVVVPKGVIVAAAMKIAFKPRNPATFLDVVVSVRAGIAAARIPADSVLQALSIAAALAFNINVQNEIDVSHTINRRFGSSWKLHEVLTSLTPVRTVNTVRILCWFLAGLGLVVVLYFLVPVEHHVTAGVVFLLVLVGGGLCICALWCVKYQQRRAGEIWSTNLFVTGETSNITGTVAYPPRMVYPSSLEFRAPLIPPEGSMMEVGPDPAPPNHPSEQQKLLRLSGVAVSTAVPTVPASNVDAEITALTHRVLREPTMVDPEALRKFLDFDATEVGRVLCTIRIKDDENAFKEWVAQPKFPDAVKEKFIKYRLEWCDQDPALVQWYESFVKITKDKAETLGEPHPSIKTRLIQGPPDKVKACVGPAVSQIYSRAIKVWDGKRCRVLYASGMDPARLGKRIDEWIATHTAGWYDVVAYCDDAVVYDASCQNELLRARRQYLRMGMSDRTWYWVCVSAPTVGRTKHGIKYRPTKKMVVHLGKPVPPSNVPVVHHVEEPMQQINSGQMDTNLMGSIINGKMTDDGLPAEATCLIIVCGDDCTVLFCKRTFKQEYVDAMLAFSKKLGVTREGAVCHDRCEMEFCSKLFWEGKDPKTGDVQTVLGGKPGRMISRAGFTLSVPGALNLAGAIKGLNLDNAHVPLLNEYLSRMGDLTAKMKVRGSEYSEMKHLPHRFESTPANLTMLERRYGVGIPHIALMKERMALVDRLPAVLDFPWIDDMVRKDA